MNTEFFERPILNSPYEYPGRHWELDESGQPTSQIIDRRRRVAFITPIPKPKKRGQREIVFDEAAAALEAGSQQYDLMEVSTTSAAASMRGGRFRTRANGASRPRRPDFSNTGAATASAAFDPSSARSRPWRP